jgi:D-alanyl-D-alanine carboxypeptidase
MKETYLYLTIFWISVLLSGCYRTDLEVPGETCKSSDMDASHPKSIELQYKLDQIKALGVPGAVIALKDGDGTWASTSGFSKIETNTPMEICHLQFGQSVAKTYVATAILRLYEEEKIDLDEKISAYLPETVSSGIANAEVATVRMLLNHTSGIAEYNDKPDYVTYLLQHPLHTFTTNDYLNYVRNEPAKFSPGEKYGYTNTNYILLALIADEITGDHKKFLREEILVTHGLNNTYYHHPGFMKMPRLVNTYWDRYSNGEIENVSEMHRVNVGSLIRDDGVIATPIDFITFLEKLLTNQILYASTMSQMLDFVQIEPDSENGYGLGIQREHHNGRPELGHSGGGIGSGCLLGYLPHNDTYYFIGINLGVSIRPQVADPFEDLIGEIREILQQ